MNLATVISYNVVVSLLFAMFGSNSCKYTIIPLHMLFYIVWKEQLSAVKYLGFATQCVHGSVLLCCYIMVHGKSQQIKVKTKFD